MVSPKIILNEDYLDLRKCPENSLNSRRSNTGTYTTHQRDGSSTNQNLKSDGIRLEKELINCGLKKLVTTYNATAAHTNLQRQLSNRKRYLQRDQSSRYDPRFRKFLVPDDKVCLKSMSEASITPKKLAETVTTSIPLFPREKTSNIEVESPKKKYESYKNRFTMTKADDSQERGVKSRRSDLSRGKQQSLFDSYAKGIPKDFSHLHKEYVVNEARLDPRLQEKYSILKLPWKRTWTIPVFSRKSSTINGLKNLDHVDRQTYLYDDGTEIDSYIEQKHRQMFSNVFQSQFVGILFLVGSLCGILLVSLLIWFIFGFDFFRILFKPRDVEDATIKKYIKYIGGGLVHFVTRFFRTLGKVLSTRTQRVYQAPQQRYQWPPLRQFPVE